jgi:hypothetical protein
VNSAVHKNIIEERFGGKLQWDEKLDVKRCTVTSTPIKLGISDRSKQEQLLDQLSDDLIKLHSALEPYYGWLEVNID